MMEGRAPWCKRTTAPITATSCTELQRRRPWGRRARPPGGWFRAGAHREHRSVRDLRGAFSPLGASRSGLAQRQRGLARGDGPDAPSTVGPQLSDCVGLWASAPRRSCGSRW